MLNLDTHIVVATLNGSLDLRERERISADPLAISDIVLWELAKLVQLGRLVLDMESYEFGVFVRSVQVLPITPAIALRSTTLDFSSDPANEIIAATSIVEQIPLLTRDRRILSSRIVPLAR